MEVLDVTASTVYLPFISKKLRGMPSHVNIDFKKCVHK